MSVKVHKAWLVWFLKIAKEDVRRKDWLSASNNYRSAAFHQQCIDFIKGWAG